MWHGMVGTVGCSRAGLSPTASPTWVNRGQTGVTSPHTGEESSPNWSKVVGKELLDISGLSATQLPAAGPVNCTGTLKQLRVELQHEASPRRSYTKSRTGMRVGRRGRRDGGCSWLDSTEVMGAALNCSSSHPEPEKHLLFEFCICFAS